MSDALFNSFPGSDKNAWKEAAQKELSGKDPFTELTFDIGPITLKPYYDESDTNGLQPETLDVAQDLYLGPRGWFNSPKVVVVDETTANNVALNHLINGADAVLFEISGPVSLDKLFSKIKLPYCAVFFLVDAAQSRLITDFEQYVTNKKVDTSQLVGGFFWTSPISSEIASRAQAIKHWNRFNPLGIVVKPNSDPTKEIAEGLCEAVRVISDAGKDSVSKICFSINTGTDFFSDIAKLKCLRRLWRQIQGAYVAPQTHLHIHGISSPWTNEKYSPNGNMIKSTTSALSAVLGGCDSITVESEDDKSPFKERVARNVLNILREESKLNQPADPTAGSYFLEDCIEQFSQRAWQQFQDLVKS
ncbi:MAG: methylmalonyl-CoA mutase family protein [Cyclobacteriaceae bacterium]